MSWDQVISLKVSVLEGVELQIGLIGFVVLAVVMGATIYLWKRYFRGWSATEFSVNLGKIGSVTLKRNHEVASIAHKAWTELKTRKAALPFDESNDVISEIYDSWYVLFKEFRELIKTIPAEHISKDENIEKLVDLMVSVLNEGLRPHLTKWHAKFRHWFNDQSKVRVSDCPQSIQKYFPEYQNLVNELKELNTKLLEYSKFLRKVAHGK